MEERVLLVCLVLRETLVCLVWMDVTVFLELLVPKVTREVNVGPVPLVPRERRESLV